MAVKLIILCLITVQVIWGRDISIQDVHDEAEKELNELQDKINNNTADAKNRIEVSKTDFGNVTGTLLKDLPGLVSRTIRKNIDDINNAKLDAESNGFSCPECDQYLNEIERTSTAAIASVKDCIGTIQRDVDSANNKALSDLAAIQGDINIFKDDLDLCDDNRCNSDMLDKIEEYDPESPSKVADNFISEINGLKNPQSCEDDTIKKLVTEGEETEKKAVDCYADTTTNCVTNNRGVTKAALDALTLNMTKEVFRVKFIIEETKPTTPNPKEMFKLLDDKLEQNKEDIYYSQLNAKKAGRERSNCDRIVLQFFNIEFTAQDIALECFETTVIGTWNDANKVAQNALNLILKDVWQFLKIWEACGDNVACNKDLLNQINEYDTQKPAAFLQEFKDKIIFIDDKQTVCTDTVIQEAVKEGTEFAENARKCYA